MSLFTGSALSGQLRSAVAAGVSVLAPGACFGPASPGRIKTRESRRFAIWRQLASGEATSAARFFGIASSFASSCSQRSNSPQCCQVRASSWWVTTHVPVCPTAPCAAKESSTGPLLPSPPSSGRRLFAKVVAPPRLSLPRSSVTLTEEEHQRRTPEFGGEAWPKTPEFGTEQTRQRAEGQRDERSRRDATRASVARDLTPVLLKRRTLATVSFGKDEQRWPLASTKGGQHELSRHTERGSRPWRCRGLDRRLVTRGPEANPRAVHAEVPCSRRPVCGEEAKPQKCGKCYRFLKAKGAKPPFCVCAFTSKWGRVP